MDWSQDETFKFIELFQKERIIWDPKHKCHKNSQKSKRCMGEIVRRNGKISNRIKK